MWMGDTYRGAHVKVTGQLWCHFPPFHFFRVFQIQSLGHHQRCLYPLSHLSGPLGMFLNYFLDVSVKVSNAVGRHCDQSTLGRKSLSYKSLVQGSEENQGRTSRKELKQKQWRIAAY